MQGLFYTQKRQLKGIKFYIMITMQVDLMNTRQKISYEFFVLNFCFNSILLKIFLKIF